MPEVISAEKTLVDGRVAQAILTLGDDEESSTLVVRVAGEPVFTISVGDPPAVLTDPFPLPWSKVGIAVSTPGMEQPTAHIDLEFLPMMFGGGYVRGRVGNTNLRQTPIELITETSLSSHLDDPFSLPALDLSHLDNLPFYDLAQQLRQKVAESLAKPAPPKDPKKDPKKPPKNPDKEKKCKSCRADCHIDMLECSYGARKLKGYAKWIALAFCGVKYGKCWKWGCPDC